MSFKKYPTFQNLNLPQIGKDILQYWKERNIFQQSLELRKNSKLWVFYEGPPSANGQPGIHHVMGRTIKDVFCRYKTLQGFLVNRKAGWDTHGLPIELGVEKSLGITKEDIGNQSSPKYISVENYNLACKAEVMKYTNKWEEITEKIGYWVDMKNPYVTYNNKYIESVWWLLKQLDNQKLLYKSYTIQPFSPAAGTGLSSHELNQPGCYKDVKDKTATVQFELKNINQLNIKINTTQCFVLAWTTTPWTLPSNTALVVGKNIEYVFVESYNPFSFDRHTFIIAKELITKYFNPKHEHLQLDEFDSATKEIPYKIIGSCLGSDLLGLEYHQLLPFVTVNEPAFKIIGGDFVTTKDGTGVVHIAPSFGADDYQVAKQNNIPALTLVDKQGRFLPQITDNIFLYGSEYVKEAYYNDSEKVVEFQKQKSVLENRNKIKNLTSYLSVDERIILKLQDENKLFKKETYEHSYPHCWRTDKPILYYPLESWFIKTSAVKEEMMQLNKTINWNPESTGTGRFGNWLENLNDWNLSRSRFWGIPLPIWRSKDGTEQIVIDSIENLKTEVENSILKGTMYNNPLSNFVPNLFNEENYSSIELHKPIIDLIILEKNGKALYREPDLIDVWFDSGAMPYAQWHYPFENKEEIDNNTLFPADFIAEGVDQTRGWFFTLHAIATMNFKSVAFKNVISNGLVLDKNGVKMSKRLGNVVNPFETIDTFGADATRWYLISNAAPWDNFKFDIEGVKEIQRKFFGTLYNTYSFFSLYANVDEFTPKGIESLNKANLKNNLLDEWILSKLNTLIKNVSLHFDQYEPHKAARLIEEFVDIDLSNWYVRLGRRRFWKSEHSEDKNTAYEILFQCLNQLSILMSPIAPFFSDWMHQNLNPQYVKNNSVHLKNYPTPQLQFINTRVESEMELAKKITSMVLSIRKKENIKVRQPLQKIQIPILSNKPLQISDSLQQIILNEVNVKTLDFVDDQSSNIIKDLKLNFKTLGKKYSQQMKAIQAFVLTNKQTVIKSIEFTGKFTTQVENETIELIAEDVEIIPIDVPGWKITNDISLTVALDITITDILKIEGITREIVNKIQNVRKDIGLEITDKINVILENHEILKTLQKTNFDYIAQEVLAINIESVELIQNNKFQVEIDDKTIIHFTIHK